MADELPAEVLAQLSKRWRSDPLDAQMLALFGDGPLGIDAVLIAMWRNHKIQLRRAFVMGKLYQLSLKGKLVRVPGELGTYRLPAASPFISPDGAHPSHDVEAVAGQESLP